MSSYYDIIFQPPALDAPLDLTLTGGEGRLDIGVVHSTQVTLRFTIIEVTAVEDDWSAPILAIVPLQELRTAITGLAGSDYWARAKGIDVWGNESDWTAVETATVTGAAGGATLTRWEIVMEPGSSAPPVPIWTPDEDDYVYAEVPV